MRILVIGLSRDLPLGPADAMELADHLVKRAASVQSDGVWESAPAVTVYSRRCLFNALAKCLDIFINTVSAQKRKLLIHNLSWPICKMRVESVWTEEMGFVLCPVKQISRSWKWRGSNSLMLCWICVHTTTQRTFSCQQGKSLFFIMAFKTHWWVIQAKNNKWLLMF